MSSVWVPSTSEIVIVRKIITFDGGAGSGAIGTFAVFTVPASIILLRMGVTCLTDLVGATATISMGVAGDVDGFIAVTTATDLDVGEVWADASPTAGILSEPSGLRNEFVSLDIAFDILVANITAGMLAVSLDYEPIVLNTIVS